MPRRRFAKILGAVVAAFMLAALGAYILHTYKTTTAMWLGVALELLAVATALPTQFSEGVAHAKELIPLVADAFKAKKGGE